jgi:hypothetical protein
MRPFTLFRFGTFTPHDIIPPMNKASAAFWKTCLASILLLSICFSARAMFARPKPTPVDRLLQQAEAFVAKNPQDPDGHYTLARIHYLAFHLGTDQVPAFGTQNNGLPSLAPQWMIGNQGEANPSSREDAAHHAALALRGFNETLHLEMKASAINRDLKALVYLGLASLEEEFLAWNARSPLDNLPAELKDITLAKCREAYAAAFDTAMEEDSKLTNLPIAGFNGIISFEAAEALVRLADNKIAPLTAKEQKYVEDAKTALDHFRTLRRGAITPMVVSFTPVAHLDELLAPGTTVDFDLRGYGPRDRWPWIKPELGLLVWDPDHTGRIESARQLFGSYSFEIFRANGYDALAALDDNGDGVLSGSELNGIGVWFDRNSDGISTPDEVIPVRDLGIVSIAVHLDGYDGIHPTNAHGVTLQDGTTLRTWDWCAEPIPETSSPQTDSIRHPFKSPTSTTVSTPAATPAPERVDAR